MGMLWPGLMGPYGDVIGLPFTLEGVSFFVEAIFIGIYLYGWKRMPAKWHYRSLFPIVAAGVAGSFFIVSVNAWMNSPAGFTLTSDGTVIGVDPIAAMFNAATGVQYVHMLLAAYMASGFLVAGVYAWAWLRGRRDRVFRLGFTIAFTVASIAAPIQILVGDIATRRLIEAQPAKFAAIELLPETTAAAPFSIGGYLEDGEVRGAIEIPYLASLIAERDPNAVLPGLESVAEADRMSDRLATIVHWSFQIMVGIGTALLGLAAWFGWTRWRKKRLPESRLFWRAASVAGVAAVVAMEAGWITTEVGRQPWIAYEVLRVKDAVTEASGLIWGLAVISMVYLILGTFTVIVLKRMAQAFERGEEAPAPYAPPVETGT
jgi:cytochrome d ubiquinol oxidase subunit I